MIHNSSVINKEAKIGKGVKIGPFCYIGSQVHIDDSVELVSNIHIEGNTKIGKGTKIFPFACIGTQPQDLKYKGESNSLEIEAIRSHGRVWKYKGLAKVKGKIMADAQWSATIVDRKNDS